MKANNANTEPLNGKDIKILDIIHSLENPRLRLGFSKLFMISRILRSFPPMVQYCIITHLHFFEDWNLAFTILDMAMSRILQYSTWAISSRISTKIPLKE